MPEPIEYRAILNLQAALQAISIAGGYHYDVVDAAVKLDPNVAVEALVNPSGTRPIILIEVQPEAWEYQPARRLRLKMPVTVHWVSESTPTDDTSRMQTYFRGCADVEQAVAADITRGGLSSDTRVIKRIFDTAVKGSRVWAQIEIELWLHRTYGAANG